LTLLLVQIAIVLLVTITCGAGALKVGQPRVVGEIIGGILIGPSALGRLAPRLSADLFNQSSFAAFDSLSTIGLVVFLFCVGMDLDYDQLRRQRGTALRASAASIVLPFTMAAILAEPLRLRFAPLSVGRIPFVLFLGIAMSITAFPVLARILQERRMEKTALGTTAIFCAAIDDVVAWILLAVALALVGRHDSSASLPIRFGALALYIVVMLAVVRPFAKRIALRWKTAAMTAELVGVLVAGVLLSAAVTDNVGVHPLFGAFVAGVCFPRVSGWQTEIRAKLDTFVSVVLLPLFFALTGMRTRLDLLSSGPMWLWAGVVLLAAVIGKMGGAAIAGRWSGQSWREAAALGALLNTRGLVELIVLHIAYNAGVFTPTLFTMLVVMALVTTMVTTPILNLLDVDRRKPARSQLSVV
jgi:Kef-type K+ transport system membrane component KefB